ncbi:MAG: RidA family protein [Microthrixaceae bacterium]
MPALPYSPLYRAGDWACISGQIGLGESGLLEGFAPQLRQIFVNLDSLLAEHGLLRTQIAKTTIFLADMSDYVELNEIYLDYFGQHRPARSAVAVAELPFAARVELEAWAYLGG